MLLRRCEHSAPLAAEAGRRLMALFKRAPREFFVIVGSPWTINGQPTTATDPQAALQEIYDAAEFFPVAITVTGPGIRYVLEMDEHMNTAPVGQRDETSKETAAVHADALESPESSDEENALRVRPAQWVGNLVASRGPLSIGLAILVACALVVSLVVFVVRGGAEAAHDDWQTALPEPSTAAAPLDGGVGAPLWTLEAGEVDSAGWYAAGVLTADAESEQVALLSHETGETIATHETADGIDAVMEFMHNGTAALGLRFGDRFVALTADGATQEWEIQPDAEVSVYGSTPLVTGAEEAPAHYALLLGEGAPVELVTNPDLPVRAVDGSWILQPELGSPRVALNPVHRDAEAEPHTLALTAPTESASFVQHLDVGRGSALALWEEDEKLYVAVHSLRGDTAGTAVSVVPAPFGAEDAISWTLATGMELALLGPYAFSQRTGELAEYNPTGDFTRAYGLAAVAIDASNRQTFTIDNTTYTENERVIGLTASDTILLRLADGSVAAYEEPGEGA